jgi:hypothetical protein
VSTIVPPGNATLLCPRRADHPALAFTDVHTGTDQSSSPKNHTPPSGLSDDASVNETRRGAGPETGDAEKPATGAAAETGPPSARRMHRIPDAMQTGRGRMRMLSVLECERETAKEIATILSISQKQISREICQHNV